MYTDISKTDYPKTLMIRNHKGGLIWQVYHVQDQEEAHWLSSNAQSNGFFGSTLEDHRPDEAETFPNWREESNRPLMDRLQSQSNTILSN